MAATRFAADTPLLFPGLVAVTGVFAPWRLWVYSLAFLTHGVSVRRLLRRARILSDAQLIEVRYGGRWRLALRLASDDTHGRRHPSQQQRRRSAGV